MIRPSTCRRATDATTDWLCCGRGTVTAPVLEVRGLRKSFGQIELLRGIDLAIKPQELVFVVGPSGSGKSTLLRCCTRLEEPSAGSIRVNGIDLMDRCTDINAMRRQIGMGFQS